VLVFQDYGRSLLPWRTVLGNVVFGMESTGLPKSERVSRAQEALTLVGLESCVTQYPLTLSGGMQQRVVLARALARAPRVLLLDEPFASLDAPTRMTLEDELLRLWRDLELTIVLVTHDVDEALYLGQSVIQLSAAPAEVQVAHSVGLDYPRHQVDTREQPEFLRLRRQLIQSLGDAIQAPGEDPGEDTQGGRGPQSM
jgi:NitT/TauT family transport system ATP-binding protein